MQEDPDSCISIVNECQEFEVNIKLIRNITLYVLGLLGLSKYQLCIKFVSPDSIKSLNKTYRNKDYSTDVLSFPQMEWEQGLDIRSPMAETHQNQSPFPSVLGDIVISLPDALNNARKIGQSLMQELVFLIVHGVMHLCGHDHQEEEEESKMLEQQKLILAKLQVQADYKSLIGQGSAH